ncbi:BA14K family protein [Brucella oryzae]|uniref:BA14K family protein n=1 Tax=Brucella oryzae TaxID=335286 RepID=UPI001B827280|nr:BA14K family protein [Brucella oryzae]
MNIFKQTCVGALAMIFGVTSVAPTMAAPTNLERPVINHNVEQVRDHRRAPRHYRGHRPNRPGHWNGHRGYRHYRHGYRRHSDGWWYPLAAFGAGAIIGGAISQPRPVYRAPRMSNAHVQWCYNRYRSYRSSDNTFQPYNGPRRQCYSPYSR